jgi:tRNA dimethylallyltransferase
MNSLPKIIVVAGPTSSGKSDFAVELALTCNGEIISADSRQIYRGLDIGTGKITEEEMKGVKHYMLDICDINETFSVKEFRDRTLPIIDDILARGKTPILCGGTGYYIDAVIYENTLPETQIARPLEEELQHHTTKELYEIVTKKDPKRASAIDKHNRIRLIRALEIIETHGKVDELPKPILRFDVDFYLLNPSKELLEERVHKRLLKRFDASMLQEMQSLIAQGYEIATLAKRGIEYKWMATYLEGAITFDELIERLRIATWQYAKRQRTWNKKYASFAKIIDVTQ